MSKLTERIKDSIKVTKIHVEDWGFDIWLRDLTHTESMGVAQDSVALQADPENLDAILKSLRTTLLYAMVDENQEQEFASLEEVDEFLSVASANSLQQIMEAFQETLPAAKIDTLPKANA